MCPLCGSSNREHHLSAPDTSYGFPGVFDIVRCSACQMLYTHPRLLPDELSRFYPPQYTAHAADRPDRAMRRHGIGRDPWDRLPPIGQCRLLDVGCGSGAYLLRQRQLGWRVLGVEPSPAAVRAARAHGLNVVEGVLPGANLPDREFDAITVLAALPCIPEPMATLRALREMLVPGGLLIVTAHNAASRAARLFGEDWQGWDLPRQQNHFTPDTLTRMIQQASFHDVCLAWKRRPSRWRHGARRRAAATGRLGWRLLAGSRRLCSAASILLARGQRSDEIVALTSG